MKIRGYLHMLTLIWMVIILSRCTGASHTPETTPTLTNLPYHTSTFILALTPVEPVSSAPLPTYTRGPTWTPRPILTRTPTATRRPTLSIADQEANLSDWLAENRGCTFPCFWGITPFQTTFQEVREMMREIGANYLLASSGVIAYHHFWVDLIAQKSDFPAMGIGLYEDTQSGLILSGELNIRLDLIKSVWRDVLRVYYLDAILSEYGPPSYVLIDAGVFHGDPSSKYYAIQMDYSEFDFQIRVSSNDALVTEDALVICPAFESAVEIELFLSVRELERIRGSNYIGDAGGMLEDISSMSLDEFSTYFVDSAGDIPCIDIPRDLWPGQ